MHLRNGVVEKRQLRNDAFQGLEALFNSCTPPAIV